MRISAVMPARNEGSRIGATVTELLAFVDEVVVVDDASDDATRDIARTAGAVVVRNPSRTGYVQAIRRGFTTATGDVVVTVDADGEMPVERIPDLVAPIVAGRAGMVQGHREQVPRVSERLVTQLARLGGPVGDSGTGFRALRRDLACGMEIRGSCICGSLALEVLARGERIEEVPVKTRLIRDRPRRIAWRHAGQALLVAGLVVRARAGRRRPSATRPG